MSNLSETLTDAMKTLFGEDTRSMNLMRTSVIFSAIITILVATCSAAGPLEDQSGTVVVVPFVNLEPHADTDPIAAGIVGAMELRVGAVPGGHMVPFLTVRDVMKYRKIDPASVTDAALAATMNELLGATRIMLGAYRVTDGGMILNARVVDGRTGVTVAARKIDTSRSGIAAALTELSGLLLDSLNKEVVQSSDGVVHVRGVPPTRGVTLVGEARELLKLPENPALQAFAHYSRAVELVKLEERAKWAGKAIAADRSYYSAYLLRADVLLGPDASSAKGNQALREQASDDLEKATSMAGNHPSLRWCRANFHLAGEDYDAVLADTAWFLKHDPNSLHGLELLCTAHRRSEDFLAMGLVARRMVKAYPWAYSGWMLRAMAYMRAGDPRGAIERLTEGIDAVPWSQPLYMCRSDLYQHCGDIEKALADLTGITELSPRTSYPYLKRGRILYENGRLGEALMNLNRAIELDNEMPLAYWYRSRAYFGSGCYSEAAADLVRCKELGFDIPDGVIEDLQELGRGND